MGSVNLDEMTLGELNELRDRISKTITERAYNSVEFTSFSFQPPSFEATGVLAFQAKTHYGMVSYKATVCEDGLKITERDVGDKYSCFYLEVDAYPVITNQKEALRRAQKAILDYERCCKTHREW